MTIRSVARSDAAAIADIYAPIVAKTTISFEELPPDGDEIERRIDVLTRTYPWLVAEDDGVLAGYAYATKHRERAAYRWAVDVSLYVDERHRGRGVGRALYAALFETLRSLGYLRVFAGVALPNAASEGLHRAAGFREIGLYEKVGFKFGRWHDVRWYGLTLGENAAPDEPIPYALAPFRAPYESGEDRS